MTDELGSLRSDSEASSHVSVVSGRFGVYRRSQRSLAVLEAFGGSVSKHESYCKLGDFTGLFGSGNGLQRIAAVPGPHRMSTPRHMS
jgi:hypothetical protein